MNDMRPKSELLTKIANMLVYQVPHAQIAMVCGITVEQLEKAMTTTQFETALATVEFENIEAQKDLNEGWDALESTAVANLLTAMQTVNDPDFSLKVAAVANKAQRRGGRNNRPIDGELGSRAVINLNQTFIERLQMSKEEKSTAIEVADNAKQKDHNFMPPNAVEKLLQVGKKAISEVEEVVQELPAFG